MNRRFGGFVIVLLGMIFGIHNAAAFEKLPDGVLFKIQKQHDTDARLLRIQVCTESVIRITAAPDTAFSQRVSLMVERTSWEPARWSVREKGDVTEISTAKITVRVGNRTGAVTFLDAKGNVILQEKSDGGKIITPAEVMGEKTYHIRQLFESPADEAFYGLGAHQNSIMNYKGHDVDLWQYNVVDIIPFLVSSRKYGILWDNNSRTKLGDIREFVSISGLALYGKDGKKGGLTAEYFKDAGFDTLTTARQESRIEHEYTDVNDPYPEGFQQNVAAVRWSGQIESNSAGIHKFRLFCSGYTKMWIDGRLVVDSWRQNWMPWTHLPVLEMKPGKKYSIKIEWIHSGGYIGLKYLPPQRGESASMLSLYSEVADQIDYYFIAGNTLDQVVHGYREITGKTPMLPKWAMGLWQCRERYRSQEEILSVVGEFRKKRIPLDNIVQDWFYWKEDKWGDHEFDETRYPDPAGMMRTLHNDLHAQLMISVWPKFYVGTKNYAEFDKHGWLYKRNVEVGQKDWVGPGYVSTFYDPYSEGARELYWKGIDEKLFSKGIDAWWLDSTEPDLQSGLSCDETRLRIGPTALGTAARYLNTYSLMNSKAVYEGQRKSDPDKRVFILTRSAFAGQQRYSATTWSGDIAARWYDLKAQISAGMNFNLSGCTYWATDIGGFAVEPRYEKPSDADREEWRELMTRWFQFGTFLPLFRVHGQFPYREMFNVAPEDHPAYQSMLTYDKLRYRLMPYIYSLSGMVTQDDYTIMRALVMDFGRDRKVLNIDDQYMFGPSLLINPVTQYKARSRTVYLPAGTGWYDLRTGRHVKGGRTIRAGAPLTQIPIFVRDGSIIPCGPEIQYTSEKPADPIRLFVYTGADGSFTLYDDEGVNYNYEKGKFSLIPLRYNQKKRTLTIGDRQGSFPGMPEKKTFEIVWISDAKRRGADFTMAPDDVVAYDGTSRSIRMK